MRNLKEIHLEVIINKGKDEVWDLIFNHFGEVSKFNPLVEGSHHLSDVKGEVGCERQCDFDPQGKTAIQERISAVNGTTSFDIDIFKGGLPMMDKMFATWKLEVVNQEQTKAFFTMKYTSKPAFMAGLMRGMMGKQLMSMLVGLKYYMETDELVTKKNIKSIIKLYNNLAEGSSFREERIIAKRA